MTDPSGAMELPRRVAARLNLLFEAVRPAALQRPWTSEEAAERAGVDLGYVEALRAGTLPPPEVDPPIDQGQREKLFAQRLDCLFRTRVSPRTGKRVTQAEVAQALQTNKQHVGNLRNGKNNPSIVLAQKYADFFEVDVGYFCADPLSAVAACFGHAKEFLVLADDDPYVVRATADLRLLRAMADRRVRKVVGRLVDRYEASAGDPAGVAGADPAGNPGPDPAGEPGADLGTDPADLGEDPAGSGSPPPGPRG
ncbi:helix-turn-helix transcriptional regulator [Streptomyces jumonjinensis]|uniref:helix-turn-helix transcriptional regulator n=1 Tax=Streptomyces jumonjinensis TaxID=1945 RepID=UPI0037943052